MIPRQYACSWDDHEIVRAGLRVVLERAGIAVVGEAASASDAVKAAVSLNPDVVLMDVRLPDGSGVGACREIRAARPAIKVLFLTAFEDEEALLATVFASAEGYLLKEIGGEHLGQAVKTVASGLSVLNPNNTRPVLERLRGLAMATAKGGVCEPLSAQERRIIELVATGKTNKEIAAAMGLSPHFPYQDGIDANPLSLPVLRGVTILNGWSQAIENRQGAEVPPR